MDIVTGDTLVISAFHFIFRRILTFSLLSRTIILFSYKCTCVNFLELQVVGECVVHLSTYTYVYIHFGIQNPAMGVKSLSYCRMKVYIICCNIVFVLLLHEANCQSPISSGNFSLCLLQFYRNSIHIRVSNLAINDLVSRKFFGLLE